MIEHTLELGKAAVEGFNAAKIDPEYAQEVANKATQMLERIAGEIRKALEEIIKAFAPLVKAVLEVVKKLYDALLVATARAINPKWLHYWMHGKKRRTREKYRKRIEREFLKIIQRAALEAISE